MKYPILLRKAVGCTLGDAWKKQQRQLLLANFRASRKNKALGKALTRFLVRLKIYVQKKIREEWRGVGGGREWEKAKGRGKRSPVARVPDVP